MIPKQIFMSQTLNNLVARLFIFGRNNLDHQVALVISRVRQKMSRKLCRCLETVDNLRIFYRYGVAI